MIVFLPAIWPKKVFQLPLTHSPCAGYVVWVGLKVINRNNSMASGFRSSVWDPALILGQIVFMQCFFYVSLGILFVAASIFTETQKSLDQLFNFHVRTRLI